VCPCGACRHSLPFYWSWPFPLPGMGGATLRWVNDQKLGVSIGGCIKSSSCVSFPVFPLILPHAPLQSSPHHQIHRGRPRPLLINYDVYVGGLRRYVFSILYERGLPHTDSIFPVLLLFGAGTFFRLAYHRCSEESSTGDTHIHPPHPPVLPRRKVSYPASGVNRVHANASQGPSPAPHVSLLSKGEVGR